MIARQQAVLLPFCMYSVCNHLLMYIIIFIFFAGLRSAFEVAERYLLRQLGENRRSACKVLNHKQHCHGEHRYRSIFVATYSGERLYQFMCTVCCGAFNRCRCQRQQLRANHLHQRHLAVQADEGRGRRGDVAHRRGHRSRSVEDGGNIRVDRAGRRRRVPRAILQALAAQVRSKKKHLYVTGN